MKKAICLLLAIVLAASFAACNAQDNTQTDYEIDEPEMSSAEIDEWFEWFISLPPEEQAAVSFRPPNFEQIMRDVYGIEVSSPETDQPPQAVVVG